MSAAEEDRYALAARIAKEINDEMDAERYRRRWLVSQTPQGGPEVWEVFVADRYREILFASEEEAKRVSDGLNDSRILLREDGTLDERGARFQVHPRPGREEPEYAVIDTQTSEELGVWRLRLAARQMADRLNTEEEQ